MTKTLIANAVCTACGCVCDDIDLTVEAGRITQAQHACGLGELWFGRAPVDPPQAQTWVDGRASTPEAALAAAAQLLSRARRPLVYGLVHTTCEAQQQAVALADRLGAVIDIAASIASGLSGLAFQALGKSTATLGEVRQRADLIVYWGADPLETHPRHLERFVAPDTAKRTVVVIDTQRTRTAQTADVFLQIKPERDFELLGALRALIGGKPLTADASADIGLPLEAIQDLAERMKGCRYGAIFVGAGFLAAQAGHYNAKALITLADEMNAFTRFVILPVYGRGNAAGASQVLTWQTGYPFAVDFSRGYPRFAPGECAGAAMLARGECDAVLIVAGSGLPSEVVAHLQRVPTVVVGAAPAELNASAKVVIPTATYGIHTGGTVYRMDDISLALRPALPSALPSDEMTLLAINNQIRQLHRVG